MNGRQEEIKIQTGLKSFDVKLIIILTYNIHACVEVEVIKKETAMLVKANNYCIILCILWSEHVFLNEDKSFISAAISVKQLIGIW